MSHIPQRLVSSWAVSHFTVEGETRWLEWSSGLLLRELAVRGIHGPTQAMLSITQSGA